MSTSTLLRELVNEDGSLSITDHGAHLLNWTPRNTLPVLWTPRTISISEDQPIRGGIPIIAPWFASGFHHGQPANFQPFHSFARICDWHIADEISQDNTHIIYTLSSSAMPESVLRHAMLTGDCHDHHARFLLQYRVTLGHTLQLALDFINQSDCPLRIDMGFHTYFRVDDITHIQVTGLEDAAYYDALTNTAHGPTHRPLTFDGPTDSVYDASDQVKIVDPLLERSISITPHGATRTIVWNPWTEGDNAADMARGDWRHFVCVEAAICREGQAIVPPQSTLTLAQEIAITAL